MMYAAIVNNKVHALISITKPEERAEYEAECEMLVELSEHVPCVGDNYINGTFSSENEQE